MSFYPYFKQNGELAENIKFLKQLKDVNNNLLPISGDLFFFDGFVNKWDAGNGASILTIGNISNIADPKGLSILANSLRLHEATSTTGGVLSDTTQQIKGEKEFLDNILTPQIGPIGNNIALDPNAFKIDLDAQNINLVQVPTTVNTNTDLITRNAVSGELEIRTVASLPAATPTGTAASIPYWNSSATWVNNSTVMQIDTSQFNNVKLGGSSTSMVGSCLGAALLGGVSNSINACQTAFVVGGQFNTIVGGGGRNAIIAGELNNINTATGFGDVILGGQGNSITSPNGRNVILGGSGSSVSGGTANVIMGGVGTTTNGTNTLIVNNTNANKTNTQSFVTKIYTDNGVLIGDDLNDVTIPASTLLNLDSTTKALRLMRMTTAQRNALTPLSGMIVYDSTLNQLFSYNGSAWMSLISSLSTGNVQYRDALRFDTSFASATASINSNFQGEFVFANSGTPYILWTEQLTGTVSNISIDLYWYSAATGNVVWIVEYGKQIVGSAIVQASTGSGTVTSSSSVANNVNTGNISISSVSGANNDILSLKLYRDATAGGDTLASQARLLGLKISFS